MRSTTDKADTVPTRFFMIATNRLTEAIARIGAEHLLAEKWLIAPSLRVGYQWLDAAAFAGKPVVNMRVNTLKGLAIDVAGPELAERQLTLASARCGTVIVDKVLNRLRETGQPFLSRLCPSAGLAQAFHATIDSIRLAGLNSHHLVLQHFEDSGKGKLLQDSIEEYLLQLGANKLIDYAELLEIAIRRVKTGTRILSADGLLLLPADVDLHHLEEQLLAAFPVEKVLKLPVDEPACREPIESDTDLLCWLLAPGEAPAPTASKTVEIVQAVGETNEIRHVLRQCLATGIKLDDVELLHTDPITYLPLIYETMMTVFGEGDDIGEKLPVTFAEGIPSTYSRPGRALLAWIDWITTGYPQAALWKMIRDGLLEAGAGEERESFGRLANLFRQIPIRFGRERYLEKLGQHQQHLEAQCESGARRVDDDGDVRGDATEYLRRRLRTLRTLQELCSDLLNCSPPSGASQLEILAKAKRFLETHARKVDQLDQYAFHAIVSGIEDMHKWLAMGKEPGTFKAWEWLSGLPAETRVLGSGPRPGCLHVAAALSGGHTGRLQTFIIGLDDSRFPGAGLQDPLLLDKERRKLSPRLPTAGDKADDKLKDFARLLARLRGRVTLSFCSQGIADAREMFPGPVALSAFRLISGQREGDQSDLYRWLASQKPAVSFAPGEEGRALNAGEWWLSKLCGPARVENASELIAHHFPHLAHGSNAEHRRDSPDFTEYDGRVPQAGPDLDPVKEPTSANRLQKIGSCPLAYFFEYGLGLQLPEELKIDPSRWLDSLAFGSLLHELFETYVRGLIARNQVPDYQRDLPPLREMLQERIEAYSQLYPTPAKSVFQRQCEQLNQTIATFLREEELYCKKHGSRPAYPEASLGLAPGEHGTPLDSLNPVPLPMASGSILHLRGRVDRIDQVGSGAVQTFGVWDYKTGSTWKYDPVDPFRQGRVLQPYLYVTMVGHRLREAVDAGARVEFFGFFFPGTKAVGDRLSWTPMQLANGKQILEWLCQVVRGGAFLATTDHERDCGYCNYQAICKDIAVVAGRSRIKLENPANEILQPMHELRNNPLAGK